MQTAPFSTTGTRIGGIPRACPVCASSTTCEVFMNRMAPCAGYDFSAPIVLCKTCGAGYAGTALSPPDLNDYYTHLSKYDTLSSAADISTLNRERADLAAKFIGPFAADFDSALDVGCSAGVFLSRLRDAGVRHVQGIDPAAQATDVARELFGIEVSRAAAEGYGGYDRFDLVCLMAVLEHLLDPHRLLGEIARQLKPGARVLIEVPDAGAFDRPERDQLFEPFGEFSNEHINFFAIGDLKRLANAVGLDVERWTSFRTANGCPGLFALLRQSVASAGLIEAESGSARSRAECRQSLTPYVQKSLRILAGLESRLAQCGAEVLIYGAGNHTARLLVQSPAMTGCVVKAVFDRNRHLHGSTIGDAPILPPDRVRDFPGLPIIVSTFNSSQEIRVALMGMTSQPVVTLYS